MNFVNEVFHQVHLRHRQHAPLLHTAFVLHILMWTRNLLHVTWIACTVSPPAGRLASILQATFLNLHGFFRLGFKMRFSGFPAAIV